MAEEEQLGRGKRVGTKTAGGRNFEDKIRSEELAREKKAKNKEAKKQEAILAADEESSSDDEDDDEPPKSKKAKSSKSSKTSKSSMKSSKSDKPAQDSSDPRRKYLIKVLRARDSTSSSTLKLLETRELEDRWAKGEGSGAAPPKLPVVAKGSAAPKVNVPAKTPARRAVPATSKESFVETLGSPVAVLLAAKHQSNRAGLTPLSARYKRDLVVDKEIAQGKRPRLDASVNQLSISSITSQEPLLDSDSRAATARLSGLPQLSEPARLSNVPDQDVGNSDDKAASDKAGGDKKPRVKGKREANSQENEPKKAKSGNYSGTIWRDILDLTVQNLTAWLGSHGFFPDALTYDRQIRKCWKNATERLNIPLEEYPIDAKLVSCIKDRVNSFRGRSVGSVKSICEVMYPRLRQLSGSKLVKYVKKLEINFHKKPGSTHFKGHYRHKAIAMCFHKIFFTGKRPIAIHFPDEFKVTPMPTIATICAMMNFYFAQFETGTYKEAKSEMSTIGRYYKTHFDNLEMFQGAVRRRCSKTRKRLYKAAAKLAGKTVSKETKNPKSSATLTREDFGEDDDNSDSDDDSDEGSDGGLDGESEQSELEQVSRRRTKHSSSDRSKKRKKTAPVSSSTESGSESDSHSSEPSSGALSSNSSSPDSKSRSGSGSSSDSDASSDSDSNSDSDSDSDSDLDANLESKKSAGFSKSKSKSKPKSKSKVESKPKSRLKSKSQSESKSKSKFETEINTEPRSESPAKPDLSPKPPPKSKPRPVPKPKPSQPNTIDRSPTPLPGLHSALDLPPTPTTTSNAEPTANPDPVRTDTDPHNDSPAGSNLAANSSSSRGRGAINNTIGTDNEGGAGRTTAAHAIDEVHMNEVLETAGTKPKQATERVEMAVHVDTGRDGRETGVTDGAALSPSPASLKRDQAKPASRLTRSQAASTMVPQEGLMDRVVDGRKGRAESNSGTGKREEKRAVDVDDEGLGAQGDRLKKRRR
ncbi:hypothetical protein RhiJN_02653 [Ceratobasidium sp. AG-Ba]|nr:hypothetical protein RhiJN_02653 [Ceratobasidium sp. AG-Ba]